MAKKTLEECWAEVVKEREAREAQAEKECNDKISDWYKENIVFSPYPGHESNVTISDLYDAHQYKDGKILEMYKDHLRTLSSYIGQSFKREKLVLSKCVMEHIKQAVKAWYNGVVEELFRPGLKYTLTDLTDAIEFNEMANNKIYRNYHEQMKASGVDVTASGLLLKEIFSDLAEEDDDLF